MAGKFQIHRRRESQKWRPGFRGRITASETDEERPPRQMGKLGVKKEMTLSALEMMLPHRSNRSERSSFADVLLKCAEIHAKPLPKREEELRPYQSRKTVT